MACERARGNFVRKNLDMAGLSFEAPKIEA
ncbi:MAG: hypothetical protein JWO83_1035 [Caulobacteraceae bacterium]|jgi:hypothetical protein|nr:hypothetical protein [Caulobacteraceae bacterium]